MDGGIESPREQAQEAPEAMALAMPLEPLRTLAVAVEIIPMRSKMALYMFLLQHPQEFPARYMRTYAGKQQRMLYDSEIRRIRELLMVEPGMDAYHTPKMLMRPPSTGRPRTHPRSPIDEIMRRALAHPR